jgi:hypothetical protein
MQNTVALFQTEEFMYEVDVNMKGYLIVLILYYVELLMIEGDIVM